MNGLKIVKDRLMQIDTDTNRKAVINNLVCVYARSLGSKNYNPTIAERLVDHLKRALDRLNLCELMTISEDKLSKLVWNEMYEILKRDVCDQSFNAHEFFNYGELSSQQTDKYFVEYHTMLAIIIPETDYGFMNLLMHCTDWWNKVDEVVKYINKVAPLKYKWVAYSNDHSYEDFSMKSFSSQEECYNDMRNAVFEKMKWNTEFIEDLTEGAVGYRVCFERNCIVHSSFSGVYVYKIVRANEEVKYQDIFTPEYKAQIEKEMFI